MKPFLFQAAFILGVGAFSLFSYLELQNQVTHLKIRLPELEKEVHLIQEDNRRLSYEIDQFQSPSHLIELAHRPEMGHLRHPLLQEILTVPEAIAANSLVE